MDLVWNWPQVAWVALVVFGLGVTVAREGKIGFAFVGSAISVTLLYFGGFWAGGTP